ncbi:MAG: tRNA (adenosine(37)-N6)-threonylcarbamoyltransferase complex dimerization subunit type 1 TsaB [Lachnospiraceae bacterium]|nr:tRNA (adenosine(37)-N6)-threonylcarbamoyltransferase complex dimerization subunit type 1 TsaB [Lachnospiraceae bacterium]
MTDKGTKKTACTILGIDTSGPVASCALAKREDGQNPRLIAGFRLQSGLTHSETLMPMLDAMCHLSRVGIEEADYIAVTSGPGSFTGLRIGASCAKGLAFAQDKPLIAVPTLAAIAYRMEGADGLVCPMMDARRTQVYAAAYVFEENGMREVVPAGAYDVKEYLDLCGQQAASARSADGRLFRMQFLGDGVPVYEELIRTHCKTPFRIVPFHMDLQSAESVCALAFLYADEGRVTNARDFAPDYLRKSQAERMREKKEKETT